MDFSSHLYWFSSCKRIQSICNWCPEPLHIWPYLINTHLVVGEAHSVKVENILFKEKSKYQEVLVFQVQHLWPYTIVLVILYQAFCSWCFQSHYPWRLCNSAFYKILLSSFSHQHMGKYLCWMALFSWLRKMNVPTRRWSPISPFVQLNHPQM